jgi:hypothetical protein
MSIGIYYLCYLIEMYRSRNAFNFVMFCIMMLLSSWFILNKRLIADHYTLQEMVILLYQQDYFFVYLIKTLLLFCLCKLQSESRTTHLSSL